LDRVVKTDFSTLTLGTVQWGLPYGIANRTGVPSDGELEKLLHLAAMAGVRTLDTARAYGESERTIGRLIGGDLSWRVITKLSPDVIEEGVSQNEVVGRVARSLEASLGALRREVLDTVLLHRAAHRTALDGAVWRALRDWRAAGRVGKIGVSVGSPEEALDALREPDVEVIQLAGSLFDQRAARLGFFELARRNRVEVFVRSVYLQGVAFMEPGALPSGLAKLEPALMAAFRWAKEHGLSLGRLMLAYARSAFSPAGILVGCETPAQLRENLEHWNTTLTVDEVAEVGELIPELPESILNPALWNR
jgi:spore coat polysaccharide biosynthesis protein SpsF